MTVKAIGGVDGGEVDELERHTELTAETEMLARLEYHKPKTLVM